MKKQRLLALLLLTSCSLLLTKSFNNVLSIAALDNDIPTAKSALKNGANIDFQHVQWYQTPLMNACQNGNVAVAEFLIKQGANVNIQDEDQRTALMYVALLKDYQQGLRLAQLLIAAQADIGLRDIEQKTALIHTLIEGNAPVAYAILDTYGDSSQQARIKKTVLRYFNKFLKKQNPELYKKVQDLLSS